MATEGKKKIFTWEIRGKINNFMFWVFKEGVLRWIKIGKYWLCQIYSPYVCTMVYCLSVKTMWNNQKSGCFMDYISLLLNPFRPWDPTSLVSNVSRALFLGTKRLDRKAAHPPLSTVDVKDCVELYLHFLTCLRLHDAMLSYKDDFPFRVSTVMSSHYSARFSDKIVM